MWLLRFEAFYHFLFLAYLHLILVAFYHESVWAVPNWIANLKCRIWIGNNALRWRTTLGEVSEATRPQTPYPYQNSLHSVRPDFDSKVKPDSSDRAGDILFFMQSFEVTSPLGVGGADK